MMLSQRAAGVLAGILAGPIDGSQENWRAAANSFRAQVQELDIPGLRVDASASAFLTAVEASQILRRQQRAAHWDLVRLEKRMIGTYEAATSFGAALRRARNPVDVDELAVALVAYGWPRPVVPAELVRFARTEVLPLLQGAR